MPLPLRNLLIALAGLASLHGCGGSDSGGTVVDSTVIDAVQFDRARMVRGRAAVDVWWPSDRATLTGTLYFPPAGGPFPAVVLHFGSNRWSRSDIRFGLIDPWLDQGIAVLVYDKRGVGGSGGECCPSADPGYFPLLATDLIAGIQALTMHPDIDPGRIGLYGFSQGGWIVPNAAARSPSVAFTVIGSGPAVSLGEELLYSRLTGDNECRLSGISQEEIDAQLAAAGPSGFDPRSDLEMYSIPGYWFYGSRDQSVPVRQSVAVLESIRAAFVKDFTIMVYHNANHSLIRNGAICETSGRSEDIFPPIFEWLRPYLFGE